MSAWFWIALWLATNVGFVFGVIWARRTPQIIHYLASRN